MTMQRIGRHERSSPFRACHPWITWMIAVNTWMAFACALPISSNSTDLFPLSIIHINDFHSRFEPTDIKGAPCRDHLESCIGGYGRIVTTVKKLRKEQQDLNPIYLNAGDNFQGTLWYSVGRWKVISQFLNMLPPDAMILGNHEFDNGIDGVVPYVENLLSPVVMTNMDARDEPTLDGKFRKSIILERGGRKIGIMGVVIQNAPEITLTERLHFRNESEAIMEEAVNLKAQGANIIVVISHCGYDVDQIIAHNAGSVVDVIVGGHSHSFLYTGSPLPGPDKPQGDYPTVVVHESSGHKVLIVQAGSYAKYVGNLIVYFDKQGNVVKYGGSPKYMSSDVLPDPAVEEEMIPWKETVDVRGNVPIGETIVDLQKEPCTYEECNLGNFYCDAAIYSFTATQMDLGDAWTPASICLVNNGALRIPLKRGNISYAHLITMSPFENIILTYDIPGKKLKEALELSVASIDPENHINSSRIFLQVAGLKVRYNFRKPPYHRVVDLQVRCRVCKVPKYEPFDPEATYRIATPRFLKNGGDGYKMLQEHSTNIESFGSDLDALIRYTRAVSPIYTNTEGRIVIEDK